MENTLKDTTGKNNKSRITYLDLLKFIAMTFTCFGHVLQRYYIVEFTQTLGFAILYSVELGIFFFVGGYLAKKPSTFKEFILYVAKLIITYLLPAFLFTCLSIWLLPRFDGYSFGYWMGQLFYYTDTFYWYFLVAFFINIGIAFSYYINQLIFKGKGLKIDVLKCAGVLILLVVYSLIFVGIYNNENLGPGCLSSNLTLYYLPIAFVGFVYSMITSYIDKIRKKNQVRICIISICLIGYIVSIIFFSNWFKVIGNPLKDISLHMLGSLYGTICYYYLAFYISRFKIFEKISKLGRYSGPFYLVHVFLIRLLYSYMSRPDEFALLVTLSIFGLMIVFYIGSLFITILLVKIPYTDIILFFNYKRLKCFKKNSN